MYEIFYFNNINLFLNSRSRSFNISTWLWNKVCIKIIRSYSSPNIKCIAESDISQLFVAPIRLDPRSKVPFRRSKQVFSEIKHSFWRIYLRFLNIEKNEVIFPPKAVISIPLGKSINWTIECSMLIFGCQFSFLINYCNSIYIYKEECLSVCLFFMHSGPVIATVTKLSMALP